MAFTHGKDTFVSFGGFDLSSFSKSTDWEKSADVHDVTCYGKNSKVFRGGLKDGKCSISGNYDNTLAGPHDVLMNLVGTNAILLYRTEGTGSGRPEESVDCTLKSYKQTSPVADYVSWTAEFQFSDDITSANQP